MRPTITPPEQLQGELTMNRIAWAIFAIGNGMNWPDAAKFAGIRDADTMRRIISAYGISPGRRPGGMREVRLTISGPRFADLEAQARQAGWEVNSAAAEYLSQGARDRLILPALRKRG